jgi:hypothetical protein
MDVPSRHAPQIIDIRFEDLVADPIATVQRIYTRFGYPYGDDFEQGMVHRLERERAAATHRHEYNLEQFGLSQPQVTERSAEYRDWALARCSEVV